MPDPEIRGGGSRFLYDPFEPSTDQTSLEYRDVLRGLGTPEQAREKIRALEDLLDERRRRDWLFGAVKRVAGWAAVVAAGWLAFKGVLSEFLMGMQQ